MPRGVRNQSFGVYLAHPFQESHFLPLNVFQLALPSLESPKLRAGLVIISWGVYPLLSLDPRSEGASGRGQKTAAHLIKLIHRALSCERAGAESDNRNETKMHIEHR